MRICPVQWQQPDSFLKPLESAFLWALLASFLVKKIFQTKFGEMIPSPPFCFLDILYTTLGILYTNLGILKSGPLLKRKSNCTTKTSYCAIFELFYASLEISGENLAARDTAEVKFNSIRKV